MHKLEAIDRSLLHVEPLKQQHIPEAQRLWTSQYRAVRQKHGYLPQTWLNEASPYASFIEGHIENGSGVVATLRDAVIGYMVHDEFDFHGDRTAFIPVMAHAADPAYQLVTYSELYTHLSQRLVERGCLSHIVTVFAADQGLQAYLFELGFGLYVVDSYRGLQPTAPGPATNGVRVRRATPEDIDGLLALGPEVVAYYAQAPLFLKNERIDKAELLDMLASPRHALFVATAGQAIVGYMGVRCHDETDTITLRDPTAATLDPLGAYIQDAHRGRGVGRSLLRQVVAWASQQAVASIHVDFESANRYGNQFWPKHFAPILYSVRRHVNSDIYSANPARSP